MNQNWEKRVTKIIIVSTLDRIVEIIPINLNWTIKIESHTSTLLEQLNSFKKTSIVQRK